MMRGQPGFWDIDERYGRLSEAGDPLERLNGVLPWEIFREPLTKALKRSDGVKGGRPPFDPVLMFKVLVLQALYNLSDEQAEFLIQDRLSFMRFLGLGLSDRVRAAVEHVFARQKGPMALGVRTIGIVRARAKIGMANLAYTLTRYVWHEGRTAPA